MRSFSEDSVASGRGSVHTESFASPRVGDIALPRLPTSLPAYLGGVTELCGGNDTLPLTGDRLRSMHSIYNELASGMAQLGLGDGKGSGMEAAMANAAQA